MRDRFQPRTSAAARQEKAASKPLSRRGFTFGAALAAAAGTVGVVLGRDGMSNIFPSASPTGACSGVVPATTCVALDLSDQYIDAHKQRAIRTIEEETTILPAGGRLAIIAMNSGAPEDLSRRMVRCSPGHADNSTWTRGTVYTAREFEARFVTPLKSFVQDAVASATSTTSPLLETTAAITRDPIFDATVADRRLVWITDGLQNDHMPAHAEVRPSKPDNSGRFTTYTLDNLEGLYRRSRLARQIRPDLTQASVAIAYLVRPEVQRFQTAAHRAWLVRRFQEAGAKSVVFTGIPQDAEMVKRPHQKIPLRSG